MLLSMCSDGCSLAFLPNHFIMYTGMVPSRPTPGMNIPLHNQLHPNLKRRPPHTNALTRGRATTELASKSENRRLCLWTATREAVGTGVPPRARLCL